MIMKRYRKRLALCKLDEPESVKNCETTTPPHEIAKALKGDVNGEWVNIPGPGHGSDDRSLGIKFHKNPPDGFIVHSLAGDDPGECRKYFKAKLAEIGIELPIRDHTPEHEDSANPDEAQRTGFALQICSESVPANGTPVDTYLKARGITCPIPPSIRFHPNLRQRPGILLPAMVALVARGTDDQPMGILRTFLTADGKEKAWCVPNKMMLGPCAGGAVGLGEASDSVMVGEGIETCLSAMQATGRPTWAALSTSGMRSLDLPEHIRDVVILADGDDPGERAAKHAASRWAREGRRVRIARAPQDLDFNDILSGRARRDGAP
jgi:putative DNA primase/helicase